MPGFLCSTRTSLCIGGPCLILRFTQPVGNTKAGIRRSQDFSYRRSEIFGSAEDDGRTRSRIGAGEMLPLVDKCGGRTAFLFVHGQPILGTIVPHDGVALATVSVNSFRLLKPAYQGDLLTAEGAVVHAGISSLGVRVGVRRQAFDAPAGDEIAEAFVTMIAVVPGQVSKALRNRVPAVLLDGDAEVAHHRQYLALKEKRSAPAPCTPHSILGAGAGSQEERGGIPIAQTRVHVDCNFGKEHINSNGVVFGGSVLTLMESTAAHCARVFVRSPRIRTVALVGMSFDAPVRIGANVSCCASVVSARRHSVVVHVGVTAASSGLDTPNNQAFFVLSLTPRERETLPCLDLSSATTEEWQLHQSAIAMMEDKYWNHVHQ